MVPFFTIITATRNAAATLPRLLDFLACQTCRDFELVIQDGASTDGTVGLAEAYRDLLPALSLDSAPDRGIYDAWNKALGRGAFRENGCCFWERMTNWLRTTHLSNAGRFL
ncbi:MAG: glycosyltransferase [Desulfovibrio sp.]|nr:glycosyltransferase [Desulfovibrio sp.]